MSSNTGGGPARPEEHVEQWMGILLRAGVIAAAVLVLIGGAIYLARHSGAVPDYHAFRGEPTELRTISGIFQQALGGHGRGLIQMGLLILIATPIARVAFSVLVFLYQRDWIYVVVTLIVLGLLGYSLLGGHG